MTRATFAQRLSDLLGNRVRHLRAGGALSTLGDHALADELWLAGVSETFEYARKETDFYRESPLATIKSFDDLRRLPILDRATLDANYERLRVAHVPISSFIHSSGTVTGTSLTIPLSADGQRLLALVNTHHAETIGAREEPGFTLRMLPIGKLVSGALTRREILLVHNTRAVEEETRDLWDVIMGHLFRLHPEGTEMLPIARLHVTPPYGVLMLTQNMLARGADPRTTKVRQILLTGGYVGRATRRFLEETWNATVLLNYSCTEMAGAALGCAKNAGTYHFLHTTFPEVVTPDTFEPVAEGGEGTLLLTPFFPFRPAMPLLRYKVGDWVRWLGSGPCACGARAPSIHYRAREGALTWIPLRNGKRIAFAKAAIAEAVDPFAYVPKIVNVAAKSVVTEKDGRAIVTVSIEAHNSGDAEWRAQAASQIRARILDEEPTLRDAVRDGDVELVTLLVPRGHMPK